MSINAAVDAASDAGFSDGEILAAARANAESAFENILGVSGPEH